MSGRKPQPLFSRRPDTIHAKVRLTPKASRRAIDGLTSDANGDVLIAARVTAAPEKGRANAALLKLLAHTWRVAPSRLSIVRGASHRLKTVAIAEPDADLVNSLDQWAATQKGDRSNDRFDSGHDH